MAYEMKPLKCDPAKLPGLSERLVRSHYDNNYSGAVKRLNQIEAALSALESSTAAIFTVNGLKREQLIAMNSMILHELYFDSLGADGEPGWALADALGRDFGSVERWRAEFVAMGKALGGGSGWVVLTWSARDGRLVNQWAADHTHALAGATPILALDMYEHSYHMDYGTKAAAYVDAFMANIDWFNVATLYDRCIGANLTPKALQDLMKAERPPLVLDVRRRPAFEASDAMLPGAVWHAPEQVDAWKGELPRDRDIAVYCVYGHNVGMDTAARLRAQGLNARYLAGGIEAWRDAGQPVQPKGGK
ncbi:MAG: superoxide dismutase [Alphaproteobacteria bacterium]|nr:superoxide dismutase [Alphaproteobacteria bacterium]